VTFSIWNSFSLVVVVLGSKSRALSKCSSTELHAQVLGFFVCFFFETGCCYVAWNSQSPASVSARCWDFRHAPPHELELTFLKLGCASRLLEFYPMRRGFRLVTTHCRQHYVA
jgi:hypothetical protein